MSQLKKLKLLYDKLENDYIRSTALTAAGILGIRKDVIRMDTNCCCNIKCIMCNSVSGKSCQPYMQFEQFQTLIDKLGPTTRILYLSCAYEPLITPEFPRYLKYAKTKGIPHISFCTNGLLLNDQMIDTLIDEQVDEIILSFNGFCEKDYNRIMKGSNFQRVCTNLKKLATRKKERSSAKPNVRINTILLKSNLLHLDNIYDILDNYNIDLIQFRELMVYDGQNNPLEVQNELIKIDSPDTFQLIRQQMKEMTERLHRAGKEIILPSAYLHPPELDLAIEAAEEFHPPLSDKQEHNGQTDYQHKYVDDDHLLKRKNAKKQRCSIPFFSYWINYTGEVRVCGYDDRGIVGNVMTDSVKEINKRKREFQKLALSGVCTHGKCTINVDTSTIV